MLTEYIKAALRHATYKPLEDGTIFGEIPELQGVWSNAPTVEAAREELQEVLEEWILLGLSQGHPLPAIDGHTLTIDMAA